jgi:hypothetical protein
MSALDRRLLAHLGAGAVLADALAVPIVRALPASPHPVLLAALVWSVSGLVGAFVASLWR